MAETGEKEHLDSPAKWLWDEAHPPEHEMGWDEALATPTLATLVEVYLLRAEAFIDHGEVPPRWRWCPDCNGEGVIYNMSHAPTLDESRHDCTRCEATLGIVPADHFGSNQQVS